MLNTLRNGKGTASQSKVSGNISRDTHLHHRVIAPLPGDKTWLKPATCRLWGSTWSKHGTCNAEKIWKSYVPNQEAVLSNEWVALSPNKWRNEVATPCFVETSISHPGFQWDCLDFESWLIPMSTMVKGPNSVGKQCQFVSSAVSFSRARLPNKEERGVCSWLVCPGPINTVPSESHAHEVTQNEAQKCGEPVRR